MTSLLSIELTNLRLFGAHGIYAEEKLVHSEFELNVILRYEPGEAIVSISQTIDYVKAWQIISNEFQQPTPLIETLAERIADMLQKTFPVIREIEVQISKLHPPITSFNGKVGICLSRKYY